MSPRVDKALDLVQSLRCYGHLALLPHDAAGSLRRAGVWWPECGTPLRDALSQVTLIISACPEHFRALDLRCEIEAPNQMLFAARRELWWRPRASVYPALLTHVSFGGSNVEPLWTNAAGRPVLARWRCEGRQVLLVGLDVAAELIRRKQGDPTRVEQTKNKSCFGFAFERANYLFADQLFRAHEMVPWADRLGFTVARLLARALNCPLVEVLPGGARGLVLLTGDDDEAALQLYAEQLAQIGPFPITYYLLPRTHHTTTTLGALPESVELGLHVDALEQPRDYPRICAEQAATVRALTNRPVRSIRNHGFLNDGYLGHLSAWQDSNLPLDVNYAGLDGTALTGSFLPFPVRRTDGTWTDHYSLLTAFGDGMQFIHRWSQRQAARRIRTVARQVERDNPGVLVFNMHPGNIRVTRRVHDSILWLGRRPNWSALGAETYLHWLERWHQLALHQDNGRWILSATATLPGIVALWPHGDTWQAEHLTVHAGVQEFALGRRAA